MFSYKAGCSMCKSSFSFFVIFFAVAVYQSFSQISINEVCSSNDGYYFTHNHEDPDWVELYNHSEDTVNLSGWKIYDKDNYGKAFILPDTSLAPNGFLIINCSDKNDSGEKLQIIESNAPAFRLLNYDALDFYYLPVSGDVSFSCRFHNVDFYEPQSQVGIVFRSGLESYDTYASLILKKIYEVMPAVHLRHMKHAWVNHHHTKVEPNFPVNKFRFDRIKDTVYFYRQNEKYEWELEWPLIFESPDDIYAGIAIASNNSENTTTAAISDIEINGVKYDLSDLNYKNINHNNPAKLFISNEIHSNFKISNNETIYLWDNEGNLVDEVELGVLHTNTTFGRYPDGSDSIGIMAKPSPGRVNNETYLGYLEKAAVDVKPGKYHDALQVKILNNYEDINIYYTTDGSEPSDTLSKYMGEIIEIDSSSVLKVKMCKDGYISGNTECFNYIINESTHLPVIAVSSDPENFFAKDHGIFHQRNLQRDIEIPAHFHYFDSNGDEFSSDMGIKAHGSNSKLVIPMKSMRLYARNRYGDGIFQYPFFDRHYTKHKRLVLRNAGQDWHFAYLRDVFINQLSSELDSNLASAFQPCIVYMNGEYWGLMYLQERVDEKMISHQYDLNDDNINFFEDQNFVKHGNYDKLEALTDTLEYLDFSNEEDVGYIMSKIDINNFLNYAAVRFFSIIVDWPCLNQKFWQSDDMDSRYRWIVYDSDISCAYSEHESNFENFHPSGCLFAQVFNFLIRNQDFRTLFINRYCDLLNTSFTKDSTIPILDSLSNLIEPEIERHSKKWEQSCMNWEWEVEKIRNFLRKRAQKAYELIVGNLFVYDTVSIRFVEKEHGSYKINSIIIDDHNKEYKYFRDIPITIAAIPDSGYHFKKWKTQYIPDSRKATFQLHESISSIEAVFVSNEEIKSPIINEIMYKNSDLSTSGDWFELYNPNPFSINIGNWIMKDEKDDHIFKFPDGFRIERTEYLAVVSDISGFKSQYPDVLNLIGYFDFGLGRNDMIRLYDEKGKLVDSVNYSNEYPWDPNADGTGYSLELISVDSDNSIPENWKASIIDFGTPGEENSWGIIRAFDKPTSAISISPNPAGNYLFINNSLSNEARLCIIDMFGRELLSDRFNGNANIDISFLESGTYFLRIIINKEPLVYKFIKLE
jgi:hypothetical protein